MVLAQMACLLSELDGRLPFVLRCIVRPLDCMFVKVEYFVASNTYAVGKEHRGSALAVRGRPVVDKSELELRAGG